MSRYTEYFDTIAAYGPCIHRGDLDVCSAIADPLLFSSSRKALLMHMDFRIIDKQLGYRPKPDAKHVTGKTGRMIKKVITDITDYDLEAAVSRFNEEFLVDTSGWTLTIGKEFLSGFTGKFSKEVYFDTTADCKSHYSSCMRYDYVGREGYPAHPCEAYNTDNFVIAILRDKDGVNLARTVICTLNNTRGPIYTVNRKAYKELASQLEFLEYGVARECDWIGARLNTIEHPEYGDSPRYGYRILPYLDVHPSHVMHNKETGFTEIVRSSSDSSFKANAASGVVQYRKEKVPCSEVSVNTLTGEEVTRTREILAGRFEEIHSVLYGRHSNEHSA